MNIIELLRRPNPANPRKIHPQDLEKLRKSLVKFGDLGGIVVNKRTGWLVSGHQRMTAIGDDVVVEELTEFDKPTSDGTIASAIVVSKGQRFNVRVVDWDEDTDAAANVASNQHGGEWDDDKLHDVIASLQGKFDADTLGFDQSEIMKILEQEQIEDSGSVAGSQEAERLAEKWKTATGQMWSLGSHRLLIGDATSKTDVDRLLGSASNVIMVTDPPYGVLYNPAARSKNMKKQGVIKNDDRADWTDAWKLFREHGDVAYVWHDGLHSDTVKRSWETAGMVIRAQIIWTKSRVIMSRGDYHWQHEPCWYAVGVGKPARRTRDRSQSTVWDIQEREDGGYGHPTQKPLECMARPIRNHTFKLVYDPFVGSGTTIMAAQASEGVTGFGMELDPKYAAVALERFDVTTGITPALLK